MEAWVILVYISIHTDVATCLCLWAVCWYICVCTEQLSYSMMIIEWVL
jgi:hypothetical protein